MNQYIQFFNAKEKALISLEEANIIKRIDIKIKKILELINRSDNYYTSSSCSGRIVLIQLPQIGDKKGAEFLGKWHKKIDPDEIQKALERAKTGLIWLIAQSPIIHIGVNSLDATNNMLKLAISCGFKNSSIKSFGRKIIIEICSTERLDAPIGKNGKLFCNKEHLDLLIEITNEILARSNLKLKRFEKKLITFFN